MCVVWLCRNANRRDGATPNKWIWFQWASIYANLGQLWEGKNPWALQYWECSYNALIILIDFDLCTIVRLHSSTSATGFTGVQQDLCLVLLPSNILYQWLLLNLEYSLDGDGRALGSLVFLRHSIPMQRSRYAVVDFFICKNELCWDHTILLRCFNQWVHHRHNDISFASSHHRQITTTSDESRCRGRHIFTRSNVSLTYLRYEQIIERNILTEAVFVARESDVLWPLSILATASSPISTISVVGSPMTQPRHSSQNIECINSWPCVYHRLYHTGICMDFYRELSRCSGSKPSSPPSTPLNDEDLHISLILLPLVTDSSFLIPLITLKQGLLSSWQLWLRFSHSAPGHKQIKPGSTQEARYLSPERTGGVISRQRYLYTTRLWRGVRCLIPSIYPIWNSTLQKRLQLSYLMYTLHNVFIPSVPKMQTFFWGLQKRPLLDTRSIFQIEAIKA